MGRLRIASVGLLLTAAVVLQVGEARGATASADRQAWSRPSPIPTFVPESSRIYVAADLGSEQARSFLHVDLAGLPEDQVDDVDLVLSQGSGTALADTAALTACPLASPFLEDGELSAEAAPQPDCTAGPVDVQRDGETWIVPLDSFLAGWRSGPNLGLAVLPVVSGPSSTFRVAFDVSRTEVRVTGPAAGGVVAAPVAEVTPAADPAPAVDAPVTLPVDGAVSGTGSPDLSLPEIDRTDLATAAGSAPGESASPPAQASLAGQTATPPSLTASASSPPAAAVFGPLVVLLLVGAVAVGRVRTRAVTSSAAPSGRAWAAAGISRPAGWAVAALALVVLPLGFSEATVYKLGLVLILLVGAAGLHILVNWAGELSLAHATMVGFPAFVVAKLSADHGISPIALLPLGVLAGAAVGLAVGLPALRARGLQVALVTLAGGIAIDRFFFTKTWFVGQAAGAAVDEPRLGPLTFSTARSLYPVLAIVVIGVVVGCWMLYRSKLARGLLWVNADPAAAAGFGVPVARYRVQAYVLAGTLAGLAGGLTAMWVQRVTPNAFPLSRSFTYLVIVALAGRGFLGGVALAAVFLEGGRLFVSSSDAFLAYGGPIGLILTLTRHRGGLNGALARLTNRNRNRNQEASPMTVTQNRQQARLGLSRPVLAAGAAAVVAGFAAIGLAWYHAGNTNQVWIQNQELLSGGVGGLALVVLGVGLILSDRLAAGQEASDARLERTVAAIAGAGAGRDRGEDRPTVAVLTTNGAPSQARARPLRAAR